jgi:hypothetical protein
MLPRLDTDGDEGIQITVIALCNPLMQKKEQGAEKRPHCGVKRETRRGKNLILGEMEIN